MRNKRSKIILPIIVFFAGLFTVFIGRQGEVNADVITANGASSLYFLVVIAGFLLITVSAIIALFVLASSEK
ncbi:MAG: hypothetical protein NTW79_00015 [Candidatus Berkelbacteria bacterium]|nr:hypothetical protein [Candidatus Berkelbacteria bacterium]